VAKPSRHRLENVRTPEQKAADAAAWQAARAKIDQEQAEAEKQKTRRVDLCRVLELPLSSDASSLDAQKTLDILMDKEKFKELIIKLNNKAFW
jgi:hypothetical protein